MLTTLPFLRNRYWVLRHGKSVPNERGLIVSSMENGTLAEYALASEGVNQAQLAGELFDAELKASNIPLENVRICYSPFSRTRHTAEVVAGVLNLPFESPQCKAIKELRERYFGPTFELLSHEKYTEIWALDEKDPFMPPEGGESVADVVSRLATALATMEADFQGPLPFREVQDLNVSPSSTEPRSPIRQTVSSGNESSFDAELRRSSMGTSKEGSNSTLGAVDTVIVCVLNGTAQSFHGVGPSCESHFLLDAWQRDTQTEIEKEASSR